MTDQIRFMVIPRSFRNITAIGFDFSKIKNCHGVVIQVNEDMYTPNLQFGLAVAEADRVGIPCFAMMDIDLARLHEDWSNGGQNYFKLWASLIEHKRLHGAFLRITNVTESNDSNLPPVNVSLLIAQLLDEWRTKSPTIRPALLGDDNIMLMADRKIVGNYKDDPKEYVQTVLSGEEYLAPCDIYKDGSLTTGGIILLDDMATLDEVYNCIPLIGLDGDEHFKQDSLYAEQSWGHLWAEDAYLTKAVLFPNNGMGVVGAMRYYGTLADLETWTGMTVNVNTGVIVEPEPEPDPEPLPEATITQLISESVKRLAGICGTIADTLEDNNA